MVNFRPPSQMVLDSTIKHSNLNVPVSGYMSQSTRHLSIQAWKRCMNLVQGCATVGHVNAAHAVYITHGFHRNTYAMSKLLGAFLSLPYSSTSSLANASLIFDSIEEPNSFIYNTIIRLYSRSSLPQIAFHYFNLMLNDNGGGLVAADNLTFHFLLVACVNGCLMITGRQIHCWVVKNGVFQSDGHVQTGLIRLYVEGSFLLEARKLFDEFAEPDVVKWNVLISGYVKAGLGSDALRVFHEMLVCGIEPDEFCVTTALTACAQVGALLQGKWIHEYLKKQKGLGFDVFTGTALVDMYAKCGCIDLAVKVFEGMRKRNKFSWAAMIRGFAVHGYAKDAIICLDRMQVEDKLCPDGVVLLGVLAACTHAGLLDEGRTLLDNMEARYGILPKHEHYSCVVDLFCRAGRLNDALKLIKTMPMKPLASVWGALLSSCRAHKNVELAELACKELLKLEKGNESEEDAALLQLSNVYFGANRSKDAIKIRRMIGDQGLRKIPGCSMVEVDGKVNEFVAGDASNSKLPEMHALLDGFWTDHSSNYTDDIELLCTVSP